MSQTNHKEPREEDFLHEPLSPASKANETPTDETDLNVKSSRLGWAMSKLWLWSGPIFPWCSLGLGIAGALMMERTPKVVPILVAALVAGAATLACWQIVLTRAKKHMPAYLRWAELGLVGLFQNAVQQTLLFSIPFYAQSMDWSNLKHWIFICALIATAGATLWDPLFERISSKVALRCVYLLVASTLSLNIAMVLLGVESAVAFPLSVVIASVTTLVSFLGDTYALYVWEWPKERLITLAFLGLALPLVYTGGSHLPPAPLRLIAISLGAKGDGYTISKPIQEISRIDSPITCMSAIHAPLGLSEELSHQWTMQGEVIDSIQLSIKGGREQGFRTFSTKRNFPQIPSSSKHDSDHRVRFRCEVQNAFGQSLGGAEFFLKR